MGGGESSTGSSSDSTRSIGCSIDLGVARREAEVEGPSCERKRVGVGSGEISSLRLFGAASKASCSFEGLESNFRLLVGVSGSSLSSTSIDSNLTRLCVKCFVGEALSFIADFMGEAVVDRVRRGEGGLFSLSVDIIFFATDPQFFDKALRKAAKVLCCRLYISIKWAGSTCGN